jgi:tetratricopeptide (TPR) repeat protein
MTDKVSIVLAKREAELYRSHGLFEEALNLYQQILDENPELDTDIRTAVVEKIGVIRQEIVASIPTPADLSEQEVELVKKSWGIQETPQEILMAANVFREIGLLKEAIDEYQKLLAGNFPAVQVVAGLVECLLKRFSPSQIMPEIERIILTVNLPGLNEAVFRYKCGIEMERREHHHIALQLYKTAFVTKLRTVATVKRAREYPPQ